MTTVGRQLVRRGGLPGVPGGLRNFGEEITHNILLFLHVFLASIVAHVSVMWSYFEVFRGKVKFKGKVK